MKNIIDSQIFNKVIQNDRSILYRSKSNDGLGDFVFLHEYSLEDIKSSLSEFSRTNGLMNDGMQMTAIIDDTYNSFYKIKTEVLLDKKLRTGKIVKLIDLLKIEERVLLVYINGKKIPDDVIQIYTTDFGTDLLIPYQYIDLNIPMKVFIENINFREKEYIHYFNSKCSQSISINLTFENDDYFDFKSFQENKVLAYINGLLTNERLNISVDERNKLLNISCTSFDGNEVEIFYNHFLTHIQKENGVKRGKEIYFNIEKGYESSIRGVIPKRTLAFYKNGMRISINDIQQVSRHCYKQVSEIEMNWNNSCFYILDEDLSNNPNYLSYNSDYYLQGMVGPDRLLKLIQKQKTETVFDLFSEEELPLEKLLNKNNKMYNDVLSDQYIDKINNAEVEDNYENLCIELVKRNPSNLRDILRNLSSTSTAYYITKTVEKDVVVSSKKQISDNQKLNIKVYLNYNFLDSTKYTKEINSNFTLITIPHQLLKDGVNYLEIDESVEEKSENKINYLEYDIGDFEEIPDSKEYEATLVVPKNIIDLYADNIEQHMIILEYVSDESGILYPIEDKKIGYLSKKDFIIDITESNYRINFKTKPKNKFLLYFRNFSYSGNFMFDKTNENSTDSLVYIYDGTEDNPIPIIPLGTPELYVNNEYFIYGIDYVFSTPLDNNSIAGTVFSFIRVLNKGDLISFSFSGVDNKPILNVSNIIYESKYGLLYFSSLEFPFHHDYLDLYIDGKKVFIADIDILSDKLIRVRNFPVPFRDIYLQSKFNTNYENLRFLFDAYQEDEFEILISKLFSSVDPVKLTHDDKYPSVDEIYKQFENDAGENIDKNENPVNEDPPIERQNLLTAMYMKWLISNDARSIMVNGEELGSKVEGYFKLYQFDSSNSGNIHIDCNKAEIVGNSNIGLKCDVPPIGIAKRMQMIIDALKNTNSYSEEGFSYSDIWSKFINDPISNIILPIDFPKDRDKHTGLLKYLEDNIDYFKENRNLPFIKRNIEEKKKITLNMIPDHIIACQGDEIYIQLFTNATKIDFEKFDDNLSVEYDEDNKLLILSSLEVLNTYLVIKGEINESYESTEKKIQVIYNQKAYLFLSSETDILVKHTKSIEIDYVSNIESFNVEINNPNVSMNQIFDQNKLIINGLEVGNSIIKIRSSKLSEKYTEKILNITIEPLPMTQLNIDKSDIEIIKDRILLLQITTEADIYQLEYDHEDLEIENNLELKQLTIKALRENKTSNLIIKAKKSDDYYENVLEVPIRLLEIPKVPLSLDVEHVYILEDDIININIETEADDFEYILPENSIIEAEKLDKILKITGKIIGEGELTIIARKDMFKDNSISIPIRISERPTTRMEINPNEFDLSYPGYSLIVNVDTDAEDYQVESTMINIATVEKLENSCFRINFLAIGEVDFIIKSQMSGLKEKIITLPCTVTEIPEETTLSTIPMNYNKFEENEFFIDLETNADDTSYEIDKEGYISIEKLSISQYKVTCLKPGNVILKIKGKKSKLLEKILSIPISIKEKPETEISTEKDIYSLAKNYFVEFEVITNASEFSHEIINPEFIIVERNDRRFKITGKEIGQSQIIIKAKAENSKETLYFITFNVTEKPETQLDIDTSDINIAINENIKIPLITNADVVNVTIDDDIANVLVDKDNNLNITGKINGQSIIHLSATALNHITKNVDININIIENTILEINDSIKLTHNNIISFIETECDFNTNEISI